MRTFYLLFALFLAALNLRPAITSVSPLLESIQASLGMSGMTASLLTTLPVLCMGVFAPFAATISKRFGLERAIFLSLVLITIATFMRGAISSAVLLIATAFLAGVGIGIAGPLLSGFIKQYFPGRPGLVSIYSAALVVGAGIAAGVSVPIYEAARFNWGTSLAVWGLLGAAAVFVWLKLAFNKHTYVKEAKAALPIRNKRALLMTLFFGLMATVFYTTTAWAGPIVISMGYSTAVAGTMVTVFQLIQIPVSLTLPSFVSKYGYLTASLVICSLFELTGLLILLFGGHPLAGMVFIGMGAGGLFPLAIMLPIVETRTADEASSLSALNQGGGYVLAAFGPLLVGGMYDYFNSFTPALLFMGGLVVSMIVVQLALGKSKLDERLKEG